MAPKGAARAPVQAYTQSHVLSAIDTLATGWRGLAVDEDVEAWVGSLALRHAALCFHVAGGVIDRADMREPRAGGWVATRAFAARGEALFADWEREMHWRASAAAVAQRAPPLAPAQATAFRAWLHGYVGLHRMQRLNTALARGLLEDMAAPGAAARRLRDTGYEVTRGGDAMNWAYPNVVDTLAAEVPNTRAVLTQPITAFTAPAYALVVRVAVGDAALAHDPNLGERTLLLRLSAPDDPAVPTDGRPFVLQSLGTFFVVDPSTRTVMRTNDPRVAVREWLAASGLAALHMAIFGLMT